jgi:DNA invertase Pin-like site-specific DNA recombinase
MIIGYALRQKQLNKQELRASIEVFTPLDEFVLDGKERKELNGLLARLTSHDDIVVRSLTDLASNNTELQHVIKHLKEQNVGLRVLDASGIQTDKYGKSIVYQVISDIYSFQKKVKATATKAGMKKKRAKIGRRPSMTEEQVEQAVSMLADSSVTKGDVCKHLGVSRPTLAKALAGFEGTVNESLF